MAVVPMKQVLICAMKKNRKQILELVQRQGVIQIQNTAQEDEIFRKEDKSSARITFEKSAATAEQALAVLKQEVPEKTGLLSGLQGKEELPLSVYEERASRHDEILQVCHQILRLSSEQAELRAGIAKAENERIALEPWHGFDLPLQFTGTRKTAAMAGILPGEETAGSIYEAIRSRAPQASGLYTEVISATPQQTCAFVVFEKKDAEEIQEALRQLNFARPPETALNPEKLDVQLQEKLDALQKRLTQTWQEMQKLAAFRQDIRFIADYYSMRAEKYRVLSGLEQSRKTFLIQGFIPASEAQRLENLLTSRFDAVVECTDPSEEEEVPVLLSNDAFVRPVESVVESYSLPGRGERDPSSLVACFYYVLFGMMLSDAAYGLIIAIVTGVCLKKFKNMEQGMRRFLTLFFYCGLSTIVWGFLFGSFFGDAVNVIASTFFNRPDIALPAIWFEPLDKPMKMLVFCFAVGILHLFVGLGAQLARCIREKRILDGIYDVVFWYLLVGGCVVCLLSAESFANMMGLPFVLSATAAKAGTVAAVIGAIGITLTGGRESRNWFKRILKGLYSLYGITGYLSDILSYSRLLALGLATSVIASVFNKMAAMGGNSIPGVILFIVIFLIGHTMNIAINAMGAYVHTNRLQYVEFFGKFYEGGGKKFSPFAAHTKYYKVKEDL